MVLHEHLDMNEHALYHMLDKTDHDQAKWKVVDNNDKRKGLIEVIKIIINADPYLRDKVLERLHSKKKASKKRFFNLHPDVDSDKDIDDVIDNILIPDRKIVKTARQKNSLMERKAKREFAEKM